MMDRRCGRKGDAKSGRRGTRRRGDQETRRIANRHPKLDIPHFTQGQGEGRPGETLSLHFNPFAGINYFPFGNNTPDIHPIRQVVSTYLLLAGCYFHFTQFYPL